MSIALGSPGVPPTWTSSAKDVVTTALEGSSRVWLTLGHGIGNEIYWPSTGEPQVRDVGFIVTKDGTWNEVKRSSRYSVSTPSPAILVPTTTHSGDGWTLTLEWVIDPARDCVMIRYRLDGEADGLYVIVAPHLGVTTNTAWADDSLHACADDGSAALCLIGSVPFRRRSVGFVGVSDGWQDVTGHGSMAWEYDEAPNGNVALTAEVGTPAGVLALGFGRRPEGAETLARSSLADGFDLIRERFFDDWAQFDDTIDPGASSWASDVLRSAAVLACHEDRTFPGASVASLSIPWGNTRGDLGGYHLVWSRDSVQTALGRLAVGDAAAAHRTLEWLCATQYADGHWAQNSYSDGRPFWTGLQLDEVALPVVLAAALDVDVEDASVKGMVRRAVSFLVHNGPASPQDRWEENAGTNGFTVAAIVAALIASTRWLSDVEADYVTGLADYWNERIEDWLYVEGGEFCDGRDIAGYYVRLGSTADAPAACGRVDVRNRSGEQVRADQLVALDFLALVRFGLRRPDDPRIRDTVALVDDLLAVELPTGVAYLRYNGDGYGERPDGSPFEGSGVGRPWPLLAGERGHFEAQAGRDPTPFLESMLAMAGPGGLFPEQVWDGDDVPDRYLVRGRPTGSAMPLAWAHAEFVKLATFADRGRPIELLADVGQRYLTPGRTGGAWYWRVDAPFADAPVGRDIIVDHADGETVELDGESVEGSSSGFGRRRVVVAPGQARVAITVHAVDGGRTTGNVGWSAS
ncbi:MAG: glycoside hydrolase family 15 protein [Ilumatobacteraceae bacterium]